MSAYEGRFESTTTPSTNPDPNLVAYSTEQGLSTALLGVAFEGQLRKVYTYWGHTGIERGDYVVVNVPGCHGQQRKVVRVQAVLPATGLKSGGTPAKHFVRKLDDKPAARIPLYTTSPGRHGLVDAWVNTTSLHIKPYELTNHAKGCIGQIDGMLGMDLANDDHTDALLFGFGAVDFKTQEEVRKMFQCDFSVLESRALAAQGEEYHRQMEKQMRLADRYGFGPQEMLKAYAPVHGIATGRAPATDNLPRRWRMKNLPLFEGCSAQPKETTVSAKIETITYVTLPNSTARRDVKTLTKEEFFDAIAALEARHKQLDGVKRKPRALQEELDNLEGQITDLSNLCDQRFAKKVEASTAPTRTTEWTAGDAGAARD